MAVWGPGFEDLEVGYRRGYSPSPPGGKQILAAFVTRPCSDLPIRFLVNLPCLPEQVVRDTNAYRMVVSER